MTNYEYNIVEAAEIIKNKINDDLFKNVKNIDELSKI